jgi:hypothetical protein
MDVFRHPPKNGEEKVVSNRPPERKKFDIALFGAATITWLAGLFIDWISHQDKIDCELSEGSSIFGEPGWSWFPMGHTCTWEKTPELPMITTGPSFLALIPPIILIAFGMSIIISRIKK